MKEIRITKGRVALVDDEDFLRVSSFAWQAINNGDGNWYARRSYPRVYGQPRRTEYLHQFLMPGCVLVDHKNGNGLDNQKSNLRAASPSQNNANSRKKRAASSKFKGVSWSVRVGQWAAQLVARKKHYWLGYFESEDAAARAYDSAARQHFGDFANVNFL